MGVADGVLDGRMGGLVGVGIGLWETWGLGEGVMFSWERVGLFWHAERRIKLQMQRITPRGKSFFIVLPFFHF